MRIYSMEECEKWAEYKNYYGLTAKHYLFSPVNSKGYITTNEEIIDLAMKSFNHNIDRIKENIDIILKNFPKLEDLVEKMDIFLCPKPSLMTANACAGDDFIVYYARGTQIPTYMTHYITAHELGHCFQRTYMDRRGTNFKEYLELRNAPKRLCDEDDAEEKFTFLHGHGIELRPEWDDNPQEWFAEDFRYLFGNPITQDYWGLPIPKPDDKIKDFILSIETEGLR